MKLFSKKQFAPNIDWLIVGLGNPGSRYDKTRHNSGWMAADCIADKLGVKLNRVKFKSLCSEATINSNKCLIMKPTTFMNASGEAVVEAMNYYKIPIERIIVICDDISLDVGKLRIRRKGSDGGQKGLRSIINLSGSDSFTRIRVGVGAKPNPEYDLAAWVLSRFSQAELAALDSAFVNVCTAAELIIDGKTDEAMNRFN